MTDLERAKKDFQGTKIGEVLQHTPLSTDFEYVHEIIKRAKTNVKGYLSHQSNYDVSNWVEESLTVIGGVMKGGKLIKIVVRPSDGGQIILWYNHEFETLEQTDYFAELWHDNDQEQNIYSFGKLLKKIKINRIPI